MSQKLGGTLLVLTAKSPKKCPKKGRGFFHYLYPTFDATMIFFCTRSNKLRQVQTCQTALTQNSVVPHNSSKVMSAMKHTWSPAWFAKNKQIPTETCCFWFWCFWGELSYCFSLRKWEAFRGSDFVAVFHILYNIICRRYKIRQHTFYLLLLSTEFYGGKMGP